MMTDSMAKAYLERIGCPDAAAVSRENLFRIQSAHLETVPYSTLTIHATGKEPDLTPDALFDRIVTKKSGGYCFELNGLLADLLRTLGYGVEEYFARWHFGEKNPVPMRRHRVLKVCCDGNAWIVDAGVGCLCPNTPLEFKLDVVQPKNLRNYRLVRDPALGIMVQTETQDGFVPYFSFTEDPHFPQDFNYVNYYCSNHPDSMFRREFFMTRQTADTQIYISQPTPEEPNRTFCIKKGDVIAKTPIRDKAHFQQILADSFGVVCFQDDLPD